MHRPTFLQEHLLDVLEINIPQQQSKGILGPNGLGTFLVYPQPFVPSIHKSFDDLKLYLMILHTFAHYFCFSDLALYLQMGTSGTHEEKEEERQMKEQTKMKESSTKNVAAVSSVTVKTECGRITTVERVANITKGNESETVQKMDVESGRMQVIQVEVHRNPETSNIWTVGVNTENEGRSTPQGSDEEDQPVVEFKEQAYELTQAHELEPEYHEMTEEQEAEAVQVLTP